MGKTRTLFAAIVPFIDGGYVVRFPKKLPYLRLFTSPVDPTLDLDRFGLGTPPDVLLLCSYAANAQVFKDGPNLPDSLPDGTSNTIAFAEHYSRDCNRMMFSYQTPSIVPGGHRATFADRSSYAFPGYPPIRPPDIDDVYPVTAGGRTVGSVPGKTFQVAPAVDQCDPTVAQTPHSGGMLVALADGSVRTIAPTISEATYWAAVTPAGGESLGSDW